MARLDPRVTRILGHIVWLVVTVAALLYLLRERPSELWLLNPDATPLEVVFAETSTTIAPGRVARFELPPEPHQRLVFTRAGQRAEHIIELAPVSREVVLIDVAADAAYVAVDASDLYQAEAIPGRPPPLDVLGVSKPAYEHRFPRARDGTLAPGEPLPEVLVARGGRRARSSVYKVYRVHPEEVADPGGWVAGVRERLLTGTSTPSVEWLGAADDAR